jgi:hypothetical protein
VRKAAIGYWLLAIGSTAVSPSTAAAQQRSDSAQTNPTLEARVEQLDQEVRVLKRLRELALDSAANAPRDKPGVFALRFRGLIQTDARFFPGDSGNTAVNTFFVRRARPILEGTLGKYLEFRLQPDFGQGQTVLLGVGAMGSTGIERGTALAPALPSYRTPGQLTLFRYRSDGTPPNTTLADGNRRRLVPQAYFYTGPLGLLGEYAISWQEVRRAAATANLQQTAWQVTGSFFVTGEKASFKSATPKHPFDPSSHAFGALELAARYSELSLDDAAFPLYANPASSARKARAWAIGANWYLAKATKLVVDYEHTTFASGAAVGDRRAENFVASRVQYAF